MSFLLYNLSNELAGEWISLMALAGFSVQANSIWGIHAFKQIDGESSYTISFGEARVEAVISFSEADPEVDKEQNSYSIYMEPMGRHRRDADLAGCIIRMLEASENFLWHQFEGSLVLRCDRRGDGVWGRIVPLFSREFQTLARLSPLSQFLSAQKFSPDYKGVLTLEGCHFDVFCGPCLNMAKKGSLKYVASEYIFLKIRSLGGGNKAKAPTALEYITSTLRNADVGLYVLSAKDAS